MPSISNESPRAVYYGPCVQCGQVHGGWQLCSEPALQAAARRYAAATATWETISDEDVKANSETSRQAHAAMQEAERALVNAATPIGLESAQRNWDVLNRLCRALHVETAAELLAAVEIPR